MAGAKLWIVGRIINGSFVMTCDPSNTDTNYYMFDSEHKAWEFITNRIDESQRERFTVSPVHVLKAQR